MNKIKMIAAMFIAGILLTFVSCGDNGKSKKISIAYANWSEGIAMTNLAKAIFEDQGYDVKLLNADLAPIFTSISRKKADVFMDVWMPVTMEDYMKQYGDKLEVIGDIYDGARIGLVVPDYVTINSIEELNAEKERFSGQIVGIDAGHVARLEQYFADRCRLRALRIQLAHFAAHHLRDDALHVHLRHRRSARA